MKACNAIIITSMKHSIDPSKDPTTANMVKNLQLRIPFSMTIWACNLQGLRFNTGFITISRMPFIAFTIKEANSLPQSTLFTSAAVSTVVVAAEDLITSGGFLSLFPQIFLLSTLPLLIVYLTVFTGDEGHDEEEKTWPNGLFDVRNNLLVAVAIVGFWWRYYVWEWWWWVLFIFYSM